jgi:hypothetical protein
LFQGLARLRLLAARLVVRWRFLQAGAMAGDGTFDSFGQVVP